MAVGSWELVKAAVGGGRFAVYRHWNVGPAGDHPPEDAAEGQVGQWDWLQALRFVRDLHDGIGRGGGHEGAAASQKNLGLNCTFPESSYVSCNLGPFNSER